MGRMSRMTLLPSVTGTYLAPVLILSYLFKEGDQSKKYKQRMPRRLETGKHISKAFHISVIRSAYLSQVHSVTT